MHRLVGQTDAHVFTSLPRAGAVRAARLLAEIGDARGRFPTSEALASLAGVAPSTRKSGRNRIVEFRWALDRQLRDALVEWAGDSRLFNPWAADSTNTPASEDTTTPHAVRVLARAWGLRDLALLARRGHLRPNQARRTSAPVAGD